VLEAYIWIKLAHESPGAERFFVNEKAQKWFYEEFISTAIRYMIICRRFHNLVMMVLTQQIMVEALKLYSKLFDLLDKYPKSTSILKIVFEFDKQFYKLNYINTYPHLLTVPTPEEINKNEEFVAGLKIDSRVDVIKTDPHSRRLSWLPGTVKKLTSINIHVVPDNDKTIFPFEKKMMCVYPHETMKAQYQWRYELAKGSKVDYQDNKSCWVEAIVRDTKVVEL
jgi:hypothetical protein